MDAVMLDVPFHPQPEDSDQCGAACGKMVLAFDRKRVAYRTLIPEIGVRGTTPSRMGLAFLRRGYAAHIVTADPGQAATPRFLRNGGTRARRRVTPHDLRDALRGGRPVILIVEMTIFWGSDEDSGCHAIIVNGFAKRSFHILDPYPPHGGPRWISEKKLMRACAAAGYAALFLRP